MVGGLSGLVDQPEEVLYSFSLMDGRSLRERLPPSPSSLVWLSSSPTCGGWEERERSGVG